MKKLLAILLAALMIGLSACASHAISGDLSTPDSATPDEATPDEETQPPTEPPTEPPTKADLAKINYDAILAAEKQKKGAVKVTPIDQFPELPAGCECVSLTIALNYYGCKLGKTDIASKYLIYSDDYVTGYAGDPFNWGGAGIYPPGLVKTANKYIEATGKDLWAIDSSDLSMEQLYRFIDAGVPVVIWTTVYMNWPYFNGSTTYKGKTYRWYDAEHCVVLYGYNVDNNEVMISDPEQGNITVSAGEFERIYDEIGRLSMVVLEATPVEPETEPPTQAATQAATQAPTQATAQNPTQAATAARSTAQPATQASSQPASQQATRPTA